MTLSAYQSAPAFPTGAPLSGMDLEIVRSNAIILYNTAAYMSAPVMNQGPHDRRSDTYQFNLPDQWLYFGAFQFRTGMTKLRIEGSYNIPAPHTDTIKVYIGNNQDTNQPGVHTIASNLKETFTLSGASTLAKEYTINTSGYADGDIIQFTMTATMNRTGSAQYSVYRLYVFAYPVTLSGWPGLPTLSGTTALSQSNLQQISAAEEWIANYLNIMPMHGTPASVYETLSFGRYPNVGSSVHWSYPDQPMWAGSVIAGNGHTKFQLGGRITTKDAQERYRLFKDGVLVGEYPSSSTWYAQQSTFDVVFEDTLTANSAATYRLGNWLNDQTYTNMSGGGNDDPNDKTKGRTRHNLWYAHMVRPTAATLPATSYGNLAEEFAPRISVPYTTLKTKINSVCELLTAIKTMIDNNPLVFGRQYIVRPGLHKQVSDIPYLNKWNKYRFNARRGARLWLRGRGVKVQYGPISVEQKADAPPEYKWLYEKEITPADKVMTNYIYLDTVEGLFPGLPYWIEAQELYFAGESLR